MIGFLLRHQSQLPEDDDWLSPAERRWYSPRRSAKRIIDWRLGRWTAKAAVAAYLRRVGDPLPGTIEIVAAGDGAPEPFRGGRPLPVTLSLSHSHGLAVAAVAPGATELGCDLERIEHRSTAFVDTYLTAAERAALVAADPAQRDLLANLAWSGKESALKALRKGLTMDARVLDVTTEPLGEEGWGRLEVRGGQATLRGAWTMRGELVLTLVARPLAQPLVDLDQPRPA